MSKRDESEQEYQSKTWKWLRESENARYNNIVFDFYRIRGNKLLLFFWQKKQTSYINFLSQYFHFENKYNIIGFVDRMYNGASQPDPTHSVTI